MAGKREPKTVPFVVRVPIRYIVHRPGYGFAFAPGGFWADGAGTGVTD